MAGVALLAGSWELWRQRQKLKHSVCLPAPGRAFDDFVARVAGISAWLLRLCQVDGKVAYIKQFLEMKLLGRSARGEQPLPFLGGEQPASSHSGKGPPGKESTCCFCCGGWHAKCRTPGQPWLIELGCRICINSTFTWKQGIAQAESHRQARAATCQQAVRRSHERRHWCKTCHCKHRAQGSTEVSLKQA